MASDASGAAFGVIELTRKAEADRISIYFYTLQQWGDAQAENYRLLLNEAMYELAAEPTRAPLVEGLNRVRSYTVRWRRSDRGHRIFYEEIENGIRVLRILHTARDWLSKLPDSTRQSNARILAEREKRNARYKQNSARAALENFLRSISVTIFKTGASKMTGAVNSNSNMFIVFC